MAILGIIPARKGSRRVPGKNKMDFCGKPLISYVIESALSAKSLDCIVVNSDDEDILHLAENYSGIIPLKRPKELAGDKSLAIEYVHHTLQYLKRNNQEFDIVVILQPTSPFTLPEDIDGTVNLLHNSGADAAVSVMELDHATHPLKMKTMEGDKLLPYLEEEKGRMASHELQSIFVRNGSVYATTIETIWQNEIIGKDCRGYVMPAERSMDINSPIDFEFAEFLFKKMQK